MTNEELLAKIKAEIERRKEQAKKHYDNAYSIGRCDAFSEMLNFIYGLEESEKPTSSEEAMKELDEKIALVKQRGTWDGVDVDKYMDDVRGREPEKPITPNDLKEAVKNYIYKAADTPGDDWTTDDIRNAYIAGYKEHAKNSDEKPVPADLEEAAMNYIAPIENEDGLKVINFSGQDIKDAFIAGAKCQADHTPLPEDTVLFNKGVEEGKRLMMDEAVKWLVDDDYHEATEKGRFILGSVGIGYNGYYIPYSDLLKLPKEDEQ